VAEPASATSDDIRLRLLVIRCQVGDDQAFAQLFEQFSVKTLRHLRGLIGDAADDVQQEVWLSVYRSLATLANPGAFRTWLFRTTRHRATDYLRRRRRERELVDEMTATASEAIDPAVDDEALPDDAVVEAEIARLPPLQREALLLRFRDEMSYADIALVVGAPIGTVKTRVHHAKRALQERFKRGLS
jgi:RNA polymerase sigma-70 factor, ECF subfamily